MAEHNYQNSYKLRRKSDGLYYQNRKKQFAPPDKQHHGPTGQLMTYQRLMCIVSGWQRSLLDQYVVEVHKSKFDSELSATELVWP